MTKPEKEVLKPGTRVEVFWAKKDTKNSTEGFFRGEIRRLERGKIIVQYDDDPEGSIEEEEDFGGAKWRILDEDDEP